MAEKRESGRDLLPVLFAVAVMMVVVYFLQATEKNRAIKSGRQQIEALKQTITDLTTELTRAQNQLEDLEASHASLKQDLRSAREIIGELESKRQKHTREIDMLGIVIQQKDQKIAELENRIKTLQNTSGTKEGQKERLIDELQGVVSDQNQQLTEARDQIQELKTAQQELSRRLAAAEKAHSELNERYQKNLDELTNLRNKLQDSDQAS